MKKILQNRPLRLIFTANLISMLGSGMNSAAVTWFILQATHSEMALGTLVILNTLPALFTMPFTGVIIDREDRRRLVMLLDAGRAVVIFIVAVLSLGAAGFAAAHGRPDGSHGKPSTTPPPWSHGGGHGHGDGDGHGDAHGHGH